MTADLDRLAAELTLGSPIVREKAAREAIALCRQIRAEALRELHAELGSWQKVGDAVGIPRQDAWRTVRG